MTFLRNSSHGTLGGLARRAAWVALASGATALSMGCSSSDNGSVGPLRGDSGTGGKAGGDGAVASDAKTDGKAGNAGAGGVKDGGPDVLADNQTGCTTDNQCANTPTTPFCANGACVACDAVNPLHACANGLACCSGFCLDTKGDPNNCGTCGKICNLPNASTTCVGGKCMIGLCQAGFEDCDLDSTNGCESNSGCTCQAGTTEPCYSGPAGTKDVGACKSGSRTCAANGSGWGPCVGEVVPQPDTCLNAVDDDCNGAVNDGYPNAAGCVCLPASTLACYSGPSGTENIGLCHGGTQTCAIEGTSYGTCDGEVTPAWEICANGIDEDCNGVADNSADADGDGFTVCQGDCCDKIGTVCGSPALVNPGAIEVPGDSVDNNCNGQVDEDPYVTCSTGQNFDTDASPAKALLALNAMEICQVSQNGLWGIIPGSPVLTRADGTGAPDYHQVGIMNQFGTDASNLPKFGDNFAVLSSGRARDGSDPDPTNSISFSYPGGAGSPPADFVAPHGGQLPTTSAGCPNGNGANDSSMLRVQLKVPTNANSFSFQFRFFSQEYYSWTCSAYNDFFIAMLDSAWTPGAGQTAIPADKNISFDSNGSYISVNSQQFFTVCTPKGGYPCPNGTGGLTGTGYAPTPGGATTWLTTTSPVNPGETITLRFAVWDTSDQILDSLVMIDNFRWSASPSNGPTTGQ